MFASLFIALPGGHHQITRRAVEVGDGKKAYVLAGPHSSVLRNWYPRQPEQSFRKYYDTSPPRLPWNYSPDDVTLSGLLSYPILSRAQRRLPAALRLASLRRLSNSESAAQRLCTLVYPTHSPILTTLISIDLCYSSLSNPHANLNSSIGHIYWYIASCANGRDLHVLQQLV